MAYANDAACEFAGKKHTELIGSATTLPATVADGYDSSYEKKLDGNTMQKAKRWAISKMAVVDGELVTEDQGVGYAFETWTRDEDGALCKPGGIVEAPPIDPAEIQAKIDAQAAVVRDLKEEQGLGNSDPEVKAVAEPPLSARAAARRVTGTAPTAPLVEDAKDAGLGYVTYVVKGEQRQRARGLTRRGSARHV